MTVHMYEIMLEKHFKEGAGSHPRYIASDLLIIMLLELCHGLARHEGHNEHFLVGFVERLREGHFGVREDTVEFL